MRPKGIPLLNEEQWKALEESDKQPLTEAQKQALERTRKIYLSSVNLKETQK